MYGEKSFSSGFFTATYAVPASNDDASIWLTRPRSGMPLGVTVAQFFPPSRVTLTTPSSEPAQMTLTSVLPGASEYTVAYTSGLFMSCVIGPPDSVMVFGSWRVRSPLILSHV